MSLVLVIEERAGQHEGSHGDRLPYCKCGGEAERGKDSCFYCGRYIRGLLRLSLVHENAWDRFVRERPYAA